MGVTFYRHAYDERNGISCSVVARIEPAFLDPETAKIIIGGGSIVSRMEGEVTWQKLCDPGWNRTSYIGLTCPVL